MRRGELAEPTAQLRVRVSGRLRRRLVALGPAVLPGHPAREPFTDTHRAVLGVPIASVAIDARVSSRYHEAGFLVSFDEPRRGPTPELHIDTADLQRIAADVGSRILKLSVCGADSVAESGVADALNGRLKATVAAGELPRTGPRSLPARMTSALLTAGRAAPRRRGSATPGRPGAAHRG